VTEEIQVQRALMVERAIQVLRDYLEDEDGKENQVKWV
jgi:hypothetical protein